MKPEHNSEDLNLSSLETFQSIDMESDWNQVSKRMGFEEKRIGFEKSRMPEMPVKRKLTTVWRIAASIIVILGIGYLTQHYVSPFSEMISVQAGEEVQKVMLPDGSMVSLNCNSQLFYPEKFKRNKREVQIKGEAFFEVERNPDKPFRVSIEEKAMVEVLGTSFNIKSQLAGESINVIVVEGRVALSDIEGALPGLILTKDEQATFYQGLLTRDNAVDNNMLSWKTGILCFDQSFLGDVVNQLESHYKMEILLDEDIPADLQFTSILDNQELGSVLEEISLVLGLAISYEDDKVHISIPH